MLCALQYERCTPISPLQQSLSLSHGTPTAGHAKHSPNVTLVSQMAAVGVWQQSLVAAQDSVAASHSASWGVARATSSIDSSRASNIVM